MGEFFQDKAAVFGLAARIRFDASVQSKDTIHDIYDRFLGDLWQYGVCVGEIFARFRGYQRPAIPREVLADADQLYPIRLDAGDGAFDRNPNHQRQIHDKIRLGVANEYHFGYLFAGIFACLGGEKWDIHVLWRCCGMVCGRNPESKKILPVGMVGGSGYFLACDGLFAIAQCAAKSGVFAIRLEDAQGRERQ